MKYIIGASIGGLFGLSMPLLMAVNGSSVVVDSNDDGNNPTDKALRQEESQPADPFRTIPIENKLILPDNICGDIVYESDNPKEQAKECLSVSMPSI
jgi:hypothetical protein